ncbi:response regulator transcription factor [Halioxenophilus sp. WMMB6]|uniref:response regulator transcription factor n=1 Tax=Halioxenophilus sp. WMMB6 TaxID=3073815 RepID=UPI00295EBDD7|nr:response regulator transcription factor [Halioxenophilus sp. WMMB6]
MNVNPLGNTVLVVDDAPDSLSLINDTLEQAGISTLVALDGKQALTIANRLKPDMVLLDAMMPNMDGFETCQALKADPALSSIPVIFMTGLADTNSIVKGLAAGGVDYLTKPVNPDELLARMRVHLKNARLTSSAHQALDSIGQNIATVDKNGQIVWATPQTHALLARANVSQNWVATVLAERLKEWFPHEPPAGQTLALESPEFPLEVTLLEYRNNREVLLKFSNATRVPGEKKLQQALNLTSRESEVLYWLACGKANKEISQILDISVRTVNKHLEQVFPKLGVENRTAAAGIAIRILN